MENIIFSIATILLKALIVIFCGTITCAILWYLSLVMHAIHLHRYKTHNQFTPSKWGKIFLHFATAIVQGSSMLNADAYAVLHNRHHDFSDTKDDPHSPHFFKDIYHMMIHTAKIYIEICKGNIEDRELKNIPDVQRFKRFDRFVTLMPVRLLWVIGYIFLYSLLPFEWYWYSPWIIVTSINAPLQGAMVNWYGHKRGYRNFDSPDKSTNVVHKDFFLLGEWFQNNHHHDKFSPNFAMKKGEFDPTYAVLRFFKKIGVIEKFNYAPA
jgi:stearoyl-CoA desaturase (Delta-9 desaturase)